MQSLPVGKIDDCGNETGEIQMEKVSVRLSLRASRITYKSLLLASVVPVARNSC